MMSCERGEQSLDVELNAMAGWHGEVVEVIKGKSWVATYTGPCNVTKEIHRPGPGLNTSCDRPIPRGVQFKATFTATCPVFSTGEFDFYVHHGPHAKLRALCPSSRCKLPTPWARAEDGADNWLTLSAVAFYETTAEITGEDYWCWFDPCYMITGSFWKPLPIFDAMLSVQIISGPDSGAKC